MQLKIWVRFSFTHCKYFNIIFLSFIYFILYTIKEESKRDRSENSDADTPLTKKRRVFQSDEEDEPESVKTQDAKQARRIVSDDED